MPYGLFYDFLFKSLIIKGLKIFLVLLILALFSFNFWLWQTSETKSISTLLSFLHLQNWEKQINQALHTNHRFFWLKVNLLIINALLIIFWLFIPKISIFFYLQIKGLSTDYQLLKEHILNLWRNLNFKEKIAFVVVWLGLLLPKIYLAWVFPPLLDEVFSYTFLIQRGFWITALYYPGPNNHLFFNELAYFLHILGGNWGNDEAIFSLRLVSVLSLGIFNLMWGFWLLSRQNFRVALFGMAIFSFLPPIALYGFLGRGYMLQTFLSLVGAWSILKITEKKYPILAPFLFVISSILGFYTIPTYIYFFASGFIFLVWYGQFRFTILLFTIVSLGVFALYFPVILINGWEALGQNSWVKAMSFGEFWRSFPNYLLLSLDFLLDKISILLIINLLGLIYLAFFAKKFQEKKLSQLIFLLFITPILSIIFQQLQPFVRVWTYLSWAVVLGFMLNIEYFFKNQFSRNSLIVSALAILIFFHTQNYPLYYQTPDYQALAQKCLQKNWQKIYCNADTYQVFLRYEFIKARKSIDLSTENFTDNQTYQIIILAKSQAFPPDFEATRRKVIFQNEEVIAFEEK